MSSTERPLLADLRAELRGLTADVREMLQLRWELARLEIEADLSRLKQLAFIWSMAAVMALTALPLLAMIMAETLDGWQGIARRGWILIFAGTLLSIAVLSGLWGWFWFRHRFVGLKETLEELREDLEWAKEATKAEG
jgi:uncharacterized membrane protein YqjE